MAVIAVSGKWMLWDFIYDCNSVAIGFILRMFDILYAILLTTYVLYVLLTKKRKILFSAFALLCAYLMWIFPNTKANILLNHAVNEEKRTELISMLNDHSLAEYQIDEHIFVTPFRRISQDKKIQYLQKDGVVNAAFTVSRNAGSEAVLIYTSKNDVIFDDWNEGNAAEKIDGNWYYFSSWGL